MTRSRKLWSVFTVMLLVVFLGVSTKASALELALSYGYDSAGLLSADQYEELNAKAAQITQTYGCGVHFVLTDDPQVDADTVQEYAEQMYLQTDAMGYGPEKDGVLLVLGTYHRCYWLLAYGSAGNYAMTDYAKEWMCENFLDEFAQNDWYGGISQYLEDCEYVLSQAAAGTPVDVYYDEDMGVEAYGFAFPVGLVAAWIVGHILKSQMKTANRSYQASHFVGAKGPEFTLRNEQFLHRTVTRKKRQEEKRSGGDSNRGGTTVNSKGFSGKGGSF